MKTTVSIHFHCLYWSWIYQSKVVNSQTMLALLGHQNNIAFMCIVYNRSKFKRFDFVRYENVLLSPLFRRRWLSQSMRAWLSVLSICFSLHCLNLFYAQTITLFYDFYFYLSIVKVNSLNLILRCRSLTCQSLSP